MDNKIPQVPQVPSPSFPSVDLRVFDFVPTERLIIELCPCQPHELSAILALWRSDWKLVITSHDE